MPRLHLAALLLATSISAAQQAPGDAAYRAATGLLHRNLPEQAAAEYRAFLAANPDHARAPSARYGLAVCLSRLNQWDQAATELDALPTADFEFAADALLLRAHAALAMSDDAAADRALSRLAKAHPQFAQADAATALHGEVLYRLARLDDARERLAQTAQRWPQSATRARVELFLALIDAAQSRDAAAADRAASLYRQWPDSDLAPRAMLVEAQCRHRLALASSQDADLSRAAARLYDRVLKSPDASLHPEALLGAAQLARASGDTEQAVAHLDTLLKSHAESPQAPAAAVERARLHIDSGDFARATRLLTPLIDGPLDAEASYWLAKADLKQSRWPQAAQRLARAASRHEDSPLLPEILFDRAVALSRSDEPAQARELWADLRARFPKHPLASESLAAEASLASSTSDHVSAQRLCTAFLKAHASHARAADMRLLLAESHLAQDHFSEAAEAFRAFAESHPTDPRAPQASVRAGLALAKSGDDQAAAASLSSSLKNSDSLDPALRIAALTALADRAIESSDWPAAQTHLSQIIALPEGRTAPALLKLGIAAARQSQPDQALDAFAQIARDFASDPARIQADFERAQILAEQGKLDEARAAFESVASPESVELDPRFAPHALRHLASIASRQNRPADAARILSSLPDDGDAQSAYDRAAALLAAGQYEPAESLFARILDTAHPRAADAAAQHAIAASRQGHFDEALARMDRADRALPRMSPDVAASLRYERAWVLKSLNRAEDAAAAYEALLSSSPPASLEAHARLDLAQLLAQSGKLDRAEDLATRAAADPAVAAPAQYLVAYCQLQRGRAAESLATLEALLAKPQAESLAGPARLLAGQAALRAGRAEAAVKHLELALAASPAEAVARPALLTLGQAHAAAHDWQRSVDTFETFLTRYESDESRHQARFGMGWALENLGRHAEAISTYRQVVASHDGPTAARSQFQIGECLFAMKQHDEAVRELLKVDILYAYPEWSAGALYEAGRCLVLLNKPSEARAQFTQVVERFKDSEWARLAAEQLATLKTPAIPGSSR